MAFPSSNTPTNQVAVPGGTSTTTSKVDDCLNYCIEAGLGPDEMNELAGKLQDEAAENEGTKPDSSNDSMQEGDKMLDSKGMP